MSSQIEKKQLERDRIAELIKQVRGTMPLADVAEYFSVSDSAVNYWLTGQTGMSPVNQEKLAELLGWQYEDFKQYKRTGIRPENKEVRQLGVADKLIAQIKKLSPIDRSRVALAAVAIALDEKLETNTETDLEIKKKHALPGGNHPSPFGTTDKVKFSDSDKEKKLGNLRRYIVKSLEKFGGYDMENPDLREAGFEEFLRSSFLESDEQYETALKWIRGNELPSLEMEKLFLGFSVALSNLTGVQHTGNELREIYYSNGAPINHLTLD